jgi:hypothetical protein
VALDIPEVSFSCEYGNEPSGFIKCRGIFWTEEVLASQEGLRAMKVSDLVVVCLDPW